MFKIILLLTFSAYCKYNRIKSRYDTREGSLSNIATITDPSRGGSLSNTATITEPSTGGSLSNSTTKKELMTSSDSHNLVANSSSIS